MDKKYEPFTDEEFETLKETMKGIGGYLPEGKMDYVWNSVVKLRGKQEPKPCACKSSSSLWSRAVNQLNEFIKKHE